MQLSPFLAWCASAGIQTPLELCGESASYRYMQYSGGEKGPFINGDDIVKIPLSSCIIANTPEKLSEKLAKERDLGDKSTFAPYIQVLPTLDDDDDNDEIEIGDFTSLKSMPRFWDQKRIDMVAEYDGGQMEQKMMMDERKDLDPWAHACVTSRANYVQGHGYAMTPILDMINHDTSTQTSAKIVDDELYLSVDRTFGFGEEVFISYGDLTNLETLCNYGFVSLDNECNTESVDVRMIRRLPVKLTVSGVDGSIDNESLTSLRSFLATPEEMEEGIRAYSKPVSDTNEEEVFSFLASFLDEAIGDAKLGAEKAKEMNDQLSEKYLQARADTLGKGLSSAKEKFPGLEY